MIVRVVRMGSNDQQHVELPNGGTVRDALDKLGISTSGISCSIKGIQVGLEQALDHKNTIMVGSKVAGGLS